MHHINNRESILFRTKLSNRVPNSGSVGIHPTNEHAHSNETPLAGCVTDVHVTKIAVLRM